MGQPYIDGLTGRRRFERLRLNIPARLTTYEGTYLVTLTDLSAAGAYITRPRVDAVSQGVLEWLDYEMFGEVVWQRLGHCGLQFEQEIPQEWIQRTRALAPHLVRRSSEITRSSLRDWVRGDASFGNRK